MHSEVIDYLFNPAKYATELTMEASRDFDTACLLIQLQSPPMELIKSLSTYLEGLVSTKPVPSVLPIADAKRLRLEGNNCAVLGSREDDPIKVDDESSRIIVTALLVAKKYVDYPVNSVAKLSMYENIVSTNASTLGMLADHARIRHYSEMVRPDLERVQQELTDICAVVAWWWIKNPKALYVTPYDLMLAFLSVFKVLERPPAAGIQVMARMVFGAPQIENRNMFTVLISGIATARNKHTLVSDALGASHAIRIFLGGVMLMESATPMGRALVNLCVTLLVEDNKTLPMETFGDPYIVERAAMRSMGHENTEYIDVSLALSMLATHSANHPTRRVLNLTHESITRAITKHPEAFNDLRRLVTASPTNRRDFDTYDNLVAPEDRNRWWSALSENVPAARVPPKCVVMDAITVHPVVCDGGVLLAPDSIVRVETVLRRTNNGTFCNPFTNKDEPWGDVLKTKKMQLRLETYF